MSDLFDQVAMLALGSEANLRPRRRTRFEPMIAPATIWRDDLAPPADAPLSAEEDPLAAGARPTARPSRQTARPTEPVNRETGGSTPGARSDMAGGPVGADAAPPIERLRSTPAATSLADSDGETPADAEPPRLPPSSTRTPAAPVSELPGGPTALLPVPDSPTTTPPMIAAPTPPKPNTSTSAAPAPRTLAPAPAHLTLSASALERSSPRSSAPTVEAEGERSPSSPPPPGTIPVVSDLPSVANAARLTPAGRGWSDPLGVQARARIERLSTTAGGGEAPPAAPAPIEVTIGRLEIRAGSAPAPRAAKVFAPHVDLAAYRSRRDRGL